MQRSTAHVSRHSLTYLSHSISFPFSPSSPFLFAVSFLYSTLFSHPLLYSLPPSLSHHIILSIPPSITILTYSGRCSELDSRAWLPNPRVPQSQDLASHYRGFRHRNPQWGEAKAFPTLHSSAENDRWVLLIGRWLAERFIYWIFFSLQFSAFSWCILQLIFFEQSLHIRFTFPLCSIPPYLHLPSLTSCIPIGILSIII